MKMETAQTQITAVRDAIILREGCLTTLDVRRTYLPMCELFL